MAHELVFRIILIQPPHDVTFRARRGKADLIPPTEATDENLSFEVPVRVEANRADGEPNMLGPFTHGPPGLDKHHLHARNSLYHVEQSGLGVCRGLTSQS
jgi:hypothetical protein